MLGLGSSLTKSARSVPTIVSDGLVLQHNYARGSVEPCSTGAADINADAVGSENIDVGTIAIADGDVSISAWVYVTAFVDEAAIFSNRHASVPNQGIELRCDSDGFEVLIDEATSSSTNAVTSAKNTNQWYHVCGVWDRSGTQYIYVDGVLDGTPDDITSQADSLAHATTARIGRDGGGSSYFRGHICNVGYWNKVLTQAQVKSIMHKDYASLSASEKTGLVSWWNLDSVIDSVGAPTAVYDNHYELGSELVTNGDFGSNSSWTLVETGESTVDISGGTLNITVGADDGYVYGTQSITYENGSIYVMEATFTRTSGGGGKLRFQDNLGDLGGLTDSQTETELTGGEQSVKFYFKANSNSTLLAIVRDGSASGLPVTVKVKSISLKKVNGNHGTLS